MLVKILAVAALLVGGLFGYVAMLPTEMRVSREIIVSSSPETIFPLINNSKEANGWMPWKDSDPQVQMIYSGPDEGVGSKSSWDSKGQMGTGEALVVESVANQTVKTQLTYTKPFQMAQLAEISLSPVAGGTKVTWSVSGHKGFFFRLMGVFFSCDKMIGGEFEKGLSRLKSQVEGKTN